MATSVYTITVTVTTDEPLDTDELQHLAFVAADEVLNTVIDDERITLVEPVAFNYGPAPQEPVPGGHEERFDPRYGQRGPE